VSDDVVIVRRELERQQDDARVTIRRGIVLIGLVPLVLAVAIFSAFSLGGMAALMALLCGGAYMLIGTIAGLATLTGGLVDHRRVTRELCDYDRARQLPVARVVRG
jgi:hypothetical protein